ncbi:MATH and LRR domain-containing protein PFE0570w isoform X2 [Malaya genurostris]|uniref:MATH and LRR domain-containing protein PFE0570w isoform X2 n=1 Tax=Malaya genurostris TaxID=325434 RepID=UPI0026F38DE9|nr:MATH and LRR domain-containing protein PFE0570w isoform X2 [Malaya genurostris]
MAASNADVMRGSISSAIAPSSAIQQIAHHQLPTNLAHQQQQQHSIPNHHIQQLQNLTQQSTTIATHHHIQSQNAMHTHHRVQQHQDPGQSLSSGLHHSPHVLQQQNLASVQHKISQYSGNIHNLMFASTENPSAASGETSLAGSATARASVVNNVVVNIASVNQSPNIASKESVSSLASSNSNSIANRVTTSVTHIPTENVQISESSLVSTVRTNSVSRSNVAPGWRRIKYNSEVIYISPSGVPLRNYNQVKEYLLSGGTCKCGLPCPFRPDVFFEFNSQVPNSNFDGKTDIPQNFCLHHTRLMEKVELVRRGKKQDVNIKTASSSRLLVSEPNPTIGSEVRALFPTNTNLDNKMFGTEISNAGHDEMLSAPQLNTQHDRELVGIPLSKTPPWRKHASASANSAPLVCIPANQRQVQSTSSVPVKTSVQTINQNEQVVKSSKITSELSHSSGGCMTMDNIKSKCAAKKRPNFKDDPTGYLNQQTAILHSSISTLHSPDGSSSSQESPQLKVVSSYGLVDTNESSDSVRVRTEAQTVNTTTNATGQTITHSANGMIQVQQNCDISHMKLQQQLQFQHQLQRQNQLVRQHHEQLQLLQQQQQQQSIGNDESSKVNTHFVKVAQASPISSSSITFSTSRTPDVTSTSSSTPDLKDPGYGGTVSTSNRSPLFNTNVGAIRSESPEVYSSKTSFNASPHKTPGIRNNTVAFASSSSVPCNTITSVQANSKPLTVTSTNMVRLAKPGMKEAESDGQSINLGARFVKTEKIMVHNSAPTGTQNVISFNQQHSPQSQIISQPQQVLMTSNGQILVMSSHANKNSGQIVAGNNLNNSTSTIGQNVIIPQQAMMGNNAAHFVNVAGTTPGSSAAGSVINNVPSDQNSNNSGIMQNMTQHPTSIIHHSQPNANSNFLIGSPNNMQSTVILNNGDVIQSGQQMLSSNNPQVMHSGNIISTASPGANIGTKIISSGSNTSIITNQSNINQLINPNNSAVASMQSGTGGSLSQQVMLNSLHPNSIVIQPNYNSVPEGIVNQVVNQDGSTTSYIQQQNQQRLISPDSKKRAKKRKSNNTTSNQILSPNSLLLPQQPNHIVGPQQPAQQQQQTIQSVNQSGAVLQITPQYQTQSYQLSPGISGLTIVPQKAQQQPQQQQQILLQNGQIITQPYNIISQQVLLPTGFVMAPDTTLVQIQNVAAAPCGSIITTPQGMIIRAQSPHQQKSFLSPNSGQQYIVNNNGQVSPMGAQIYGGPVNIVVPQQQTGPTTSYVQQNTALVQQHPQQIVQIATALNTSTDNSSTASSTNDSPSLPSTPQPVMQQKTHSTYLSGAASPPDTTTHSPNSPDCASSEKSTGSSDSVNMAMVQCVSSSEPDLIADGAQSPLDSSEYFEQGAIAYQRIAYKPSKIRRIQTHQPSSHIQGDYSNGDTTSSNINANSNKNTSLQQTTHSTLHNQPHARHTELVSHGGSSTQIAQPDSHGGQPHHQQQLQHQPLTQGHFHQMRGRKLNPQLERAIQEAMMELDRAADTPSPSPHSLSVVNSRDSIVATQTITIKAPPTGSTALPSNCNSIALPTNKLAKPCRSAKSKLVKIAPAPPAIVEMSSTTSTNISSSNIPIINRTKMK